MHTVRRMSMPKVCRRTVGKGALPFKARSPKVLDMETIQDLRSDLDRARGHWPRISRDTEIDHATIARIARGEIKNPRLDTFVKIRGWMDTHPDFLVKSDRDRVVA